MMPKNRLNIPVHKAFPSALLGLFGATLLLLACNTHQVKDPLFQAVENTGIVFTNQLTESNAFNVFKYRNFYNGGGVAAGDLNNDGLTDLFFTANQGPNKLFLNKGNWQFEDISDKAGFGNKSQWSTGVVFVDINNDGFLDIYVSNAGNMTQPALRRNQLFINNGKLGFSDSAAAYGLDNDGYTTQSSFFDYDLDGDLDCFLVNNSPIPVNTLNYANMRSLPAEQAPVGPMLKGGGDHLFRNDGGRFVEVTQSAGIHGSLISLGLGVTVGDVNGDHYPDIYVSNDFFERDYLYINQRNGKFVDEFEARIQHGSLSSMGADMGDINNDGQPDIFTTDMLPGDDYRLKTNTSFEGYDVYKLKEQQGFHHQFTQNALQVNDGTGRFLETGFFSGVAASDWSWGALVFDADNDGRSDIFVCNGIYRDVTDQDFIDFFANDVVKQMVVTGKKEEVNNVINKMPSVPIPNQAFRNKGQLQFDNVSAAWGLDQPSFSNGAVYADLDNDGDLDLVTNNVNQPASIYRNFSREKQPDSSHYLAIVVQGATPNVQAIGTTLKLYAGNEILTREIVPSRGFQSSMEYKQTIGLGALVVDSVQVIFPDKTMTTLVQPGRDTLLQVSYAKSPRRNWQPETGSKGSVLFAPVAGTPFGVHTEDEWVDFYYERNLPFMLSTQGPKMAKADVNGDGREDVFIGGAKGQASRLYLQTATGWSLLPTPGLEQFKFNDVTAAAFVDFDRDGDMDLVVGGGGNMDPASADSYQHLFFRNQGKGKLVLEPGFFPIAHTNAAFVLPLDYDGDGWTDLLMGSRSVPQQYGQLPHAFLFQNQAGKPVDVTAAVAPFLSGLGMLTAADWKDINQDGKPELLLTGEWMAPQIFAYKGKSFQVLRTGLEQEKGWWQTLLSEDLDKDGDLDLVLGNLGKNFYLQAAQDRPVKVWLKDFDQNGTVEKVFSHTLNGKDVPVFLKKDLTEQLPALKKSNLKHVDYARKSLAEVFGKDLEGAEVREVVQTASLVALNNGKGQFTVHELPLTVQLSSLQAVVAKDLDQDGLPELMGAGNFTDLLPQFCRIDAGYGWVLQNKGKGNFQALPAQQTGLSLPGQVRSVLLLTTANGPQLLFGNNNASTQLYTLQKPLK